MNRYVFRMTTCDAVSVVIRADSSAEAREKLRDLLPDKYDLFQLVLE